MESRDKDTTSSGVSSERLMVDAYKNQYEFNRKFLAKQGLDIDSLPSDKVAILLKDYILHLIKESTEVLDTIKFKMHRKEDVEFIRSNTIEELIDCQKFLWGMFQLLGVDDEQLIEEYWRKTEVVEQRWKQEHELKELAKCEKVCAIDLDGVLGQYPDHWLSFINSRLCTKYETLEDAKVEVDVLRYSQLKSEYRQTGEKKHIKPMHGAQRFLTDLKDDGYKIVILTARPYKKYYRIFADTLSWLKEWGFEYDAIMFDEQKNMKILNEIPNLKFMVEDNLRFANSVAAAGYKCYLFNPMNRPVNGKLHKNVYVATGFGHILDEQGVANWQ